MNGFVFGATRRRRLPRVVVHPLRPLPTDSSSAKRDTKDGGKTNNVPKVHIHLGTYCSTYQAATLYPMG